VPPSRAGIRAAYLELRERHAATISQAPHSTFCVWVSVARPPGRSPGGARDAADRKILRRSGDGGKLCGEAGLSRHASCICSRKRTGIFVPLVPGLERARHFCISANQDSTLRICADIGYPDRRIQPLDPPLLRLEAARDLFRLTRSGDLLQPRVGT